MCYRVFTHISWNWYNKMGDCKMKLVGELKFEIEDVICVNDVDVEDFISSLNEVQHALETLQNIGTAFIKSLSLVKYSNGNC